MRSTATHVFFWSGPLSNWHRGTPFGGARAWEETVRRLDALGIDRPPDDALSSRLLRAATYGTSEKWMMATKAWIFDRRPAALDGDPSIDVPSRLAAILGSRTPTRMSALAQILATEDPKAQKRLGGASGPITGYDEAIWSAARTSCVAGGVTARMEADAGARRILLGTGDRTLVEGSPFDGVWGVRLRWDDPAIEDPRNWRGLNLLGRTLEEVRLRLGGTDRAPPR